MQDTGAKVFGAGKVGAWPDGSTLGFRNRRSDRQRPYFRADRYFTVGHEWYVTLREGNDIGPYQNRDDAELALALHVAKRCLASPGGIAEMFGANEGGTSEFEIIVGELVDGLEQRQLRSENCAYVWVKQRLDTLHRHPPELTHPRTRFKALKYLLGELEK